jgi:hypothetical protein
MLPSRVVAVARPASGLVPVLVWLPVPVGVLVPVSVALLVAPDPVPLLVIVALAVRGAVKTVPVPVAVVVPVLTVPVPVAVAVITLLVAVAVLVNEPVRVLVSVSVQYRASTQEPTSLHSPHFPQNEFTGKTQAPAPSQVDRQGGVPLPQSFSGSVPMRMGLQVPTVPASLHETQVPAQALLQHTPSLQNPLAHAAALVQALPPAVLQAPVASHAWSPEQLPATWVPGEANRQAPALPGTLQDLHGPEHEADSQHTPSTQLPDAHELAVAAVHPVPLPRPVTRYSQVSSVAVPHGMPPNSTTTPRWLSKAMAA